MTSSPRIYWQKARHHTMLWAIILLYMMAAIPCLCYLADNYELAAESARHARHLRGCAGVLAGLTLVMGGLCFYCCKHPSQKSLLPLTAAAAVCSLLAIPSLWDNSVDWMICTLYVSGVLATSYAIFRKWSVILWAVWLIPAFAKTAVASRYQIRVDAHLISEIMGASPQDVAQFATPGNLLLAIGVLLLCVAVAYTLNLVLRRYTRRQLALPGVLLLVLTLIVSSATQRRLWERNSNRAPEVVLREAIQATQLAKLQQSRIMSAAEKLPTPAQPLPEIPAEKQCRDTLCLLHIGESVRSDHLSLFGYERETTPKLAARENLIGYKDCVSVAPSTIPTTMAILTNAKTDIRQEDIDPSLDATCGGIMDLFHALNFTCYAFATNQDANETWGSLYEKLLRNIFARGADKILGIPNQEDSHSQIQQIADTLAETPSGNIFCTINNVGSHLPFIDYDKENPPFTPTSDKAYANKPAENAQAAEMACNAYDNTIRYLDDYIAELLASLEGRSYIYIYLSDHGEFLGDKGVWVRNGNNEVFFSTPVCQVPLLIITSPEFEQQNPHIAEALNRLREHRDMSIGQEHIFHTLLGLFGISSPYYEETLDLCSDKVQPYTGPHPARDGQTADGKKWY